MNNSKLDIYLYIRFLYKLFAIKPKDEFSQEYGNWRNLVVFFNKDELKLIRPHDGELHQESDIMLTLYNLKTGNDSDDSMGQEEFSEYQFLNRNFDFKKNITNPFSIFLLEQSDEVIEEFEKNGFLFMNSKKSLDIWGKLSQNFNLPVTKLENKNKFSSWELLQDHRLPTCNIVISDNYLAQRKTSRGIDKTDDTLEMNLLQIITNLVYPNTLEVNISIIYSSSLSEKKSNFEEQEVKLLSTKELQQKVQSYLSKREDLKTKFNIEVYKCKKESHLHDRCIITNYFFYKSGHSIDYFDGNQKETKRTTLTIDPITGNGVFDSVTDKLEEFKKAISEIGNDPSRHAGSCDNMLLKS